MSKSLPQTTVRLLGGAVLLSCLTLLGTSLAFADSDAPMLTDNAAAAQSGASDKSQLASTHEDDSKNNQETMPSKKIPKAHGDDYGADNFKAPSNQALDRAAQKAQAEKNAQQSAENADRSQDEQGQTGNGASNDAPQTKSTTTQSESTSSYSYGD